LLNVNGDTMSSANTPPEDLPELALEEWNRVVPELEQRDMIASLDRGILVLYVKAYAMAEEAAGIVAEQGVTCEGYRGVTVKNPAIQVFRDCTSTAAALADKLGLNPTSRGKMKTPPKQDDPEDSGLFSD
jgi:P27 family predicted phage terminase small subunit